MTSHFYVRYMANHIWKIKKLRLLNKILLETYSSPAAGFHILPRQTTTHDTMSQ